MNPTPPAEPNRAEPNRFFRDHKREYGRINLEEFHYPNVTLLATKDRLVHLRDRLGDRFVAGLMLNTGSQAQRVGDRLSVAPVDQLWHVEQG